MDYCTATCSVLCLCRGAGAFQGPGQLVRLCSILDEPVNYCPVSVLYRGGVSRGMGQLVMTFVVTLDEAVN